MDDNAPCHHARKVQTWISSQQITFMEVWSPQCPDLNPIKHVWDLLSKLLDAKKPKNLRELESRLVEEWNKMSMVEIQKLMTSMFANRNLKAFNAENRFKISPRVSKAKLNH